MVILRALCAGIGVAWLMAACGAQASDNGRAGSTTGLTGLTGLVDGEVLGESSYPITSIEGTIADGQAVAVVRIGEVLDMYEAPYPVEPNGATPTAGASVTDTTPLEFPLQFTDYDVVVEDALLANAGNRTRVAAPTGLPMSFPSRSRGLSIFESLRI